MERSILNITYKDKKTNKWIREQTKVVDILETIKKRRKWTWAGHICRRTDNRWSALLTHWIPYGGNETGVAKGKDGETNCTNTGERPTGSNKQRIGVFGDIMLRPSSCSGSTTAEQKLDKNRQD